MPPPDNEIDRQITALHIRAGSPPDIRQRDQALAWLLDNADQAFPEVLARAAATPQDRVLIDLLGRYRRPEATEVLLRAFADAHTRSVAAIGLGLSPDPAALQSLRHSLDSPDSAEVVAALAGLGATGNPSLCVDIAPLLRAANAEVRWMAVEAGSRLACLDRAALEEISRRDADADVRDLAARKLK